MSSGRYVPEQETARAALAAVLNAWQNERSMDEVKVGSRPVQVMDTHRRSGQELQHFEILGEVAGDGPRCFSVRLELANPNATEKVRFVVLGIDPLWVIREEDYAMIAHWEHPMHLETKAEKK